MTVLRTPINGICIPECWYTFSCPRLGSPYLTPFPTSLYLIVSAGGYNVRAATLSLAGRPYVPIIDNFGYCSGVDAYVSGTTVNIWKALQDGVWSSSTTIRIRVAASLIVGVSVEARPVSQLSTPLSSGPCASAYKFPCTRAQDITSCPTIDCATITVYDNGTFSIS